MAQGKNLGVFLPVTQYGRSRRPRGRCRTAHVRRMDAQVNPLPGLQHPDLAEQVQRDGLWARPRSIWRGSRRECWDAVVRSKSRGTPPSGVIIASEAGAVVRDQDGTAHDIDSSATIAVPPALVGRSAAAFGWVGRYSGWKRPKRPR